MFITGAFPVHFVHYWNFPSSLRNEIENRATKNNNRAGNWKITPNSANESIGRCLTLISQQKLHSESTFTHPVVQESAAALWIQPSVEIYIRLLVERRNTSRSTHSELQKPDGQAFRNWRCCAPPLLERTSSRCCAPPLLEKTSSQIYN